MRLWKPFLPPLLMCLTQLGIALGLLSWAFAQGTGPGPNIYTLTIGTAATMAAVGVNSSRRGLTICNNSGANTVTFTYGNPVVTPVSLTTGQVIAVNTCFNLPPINLGGTIGNLGGQVNMIASGASTPVTVFEYY